MEPITNFLKKIDEYITKESIDLHNYEIFYRGENKFHESTTPSIFRDGFLKNEHKIFRELELRYPNIFDNAKTTIDKLSIMQHYGLPTRLLDFTTNPLLALYMAVDTDDYANFCSTIKIVAIKKNKIKYYDSDAVSVFANFSKIDDSFNVNIVDNYFNDNGNIGKYNVCKRMGKRGFSYINSSESKKLNKNLKNDLGKLITQNNHDLQYLLHEIKGEKPYFQDMIWMEHLDKSVVFVKPKHNSQRIINQAGLFAIFGLNDGKKEAFSLEECADDEHFKLNTFKLCDFGAEAMMCDKSFADSIRKALGTLGVTIDKVYPEIEYSSQHIKNVFSSKDEK
ncbi:FRG domain-containing protein [Sulfurimonas sp.]|uniref:FRG domain-containing protein n=1 Tax=Sulfurimonas sp. TaxID=2022749 RepID=UPI0019FFCD3C|nr:FRG domain-containing protein [Sulfurimonas sp.]MBE0514041.1 FRG domain-containing protein [Sulfurimonas sp.]